MKSVILVLFTLTTTVVSAQVDQRTAYLKALGYETEMTLADVAAGRVSHFRFAAGKDPTQGGCGVPHGHDPEIASADPKDLVTVLGQDLEYCQFLVDAHKRCDPKRADATGTGSWRTGCTSERPNAHGIYYYYDRPSFQVNSGYTRPVKDSELQQLGNTKGWQKFSGWTAANRVAAWSGMPVYEVARLVMEEAYRLVGNPMIETKDRSKAQVWMRGRPMSGGLKGYAYFNNQGCSQVTANFDTTSFQPSLDNCFWLWIHEVGHNNNGPHTFTNQSSHAGYMSYNRRSPTPPYATADRTIFTDRTRDPSMSRWARQYGDADGDGDPDPSPRLGDDPTTPPGPTPAGFSLRPGSVVTLTNDRGQTAKVTVTEVTSEPDTLRQRVAAEVAKIEYAGKDDHAAKLASLYAGFVVLVKSEEMDVKTANEFGVVIGKMLLGADADKWASFFVLASTATSADDLDEVSKGLGPRAAVDIVKLVAAIVRLVEAIQTKDLAGIVTAIAELIAILQER